MKNEIAKLLICFGLSYVVFVSEQISGLALHLILHRFYRVTVV